jgi:hypothetical protein
VSDERGEFACSGLEVGHYDGNLVVQGKLQSAAPELSVRGSEEPARIRMRADPAATIRVSVDAGAHAPGAAVAVFACSQRGEAVLAQRDGEHFLLEGLALGRYGVHAGSSDCTNARETPVTLERDAEVAEVSLTLPRAARVRGRLVDARGAPVADAWVRASDPHPAWALLAESTPAVMTDAQGDFDLSGLMPGRYELRAQGPFETGDAQKSIEIAPGAELELVLDLRAPEQALPPLERPATNETN